MSTGCANLIQGELGMVMLAVLAVAALVMVCRRKGHSNNTL